MKRKLGIIAECIRDEDGIDSLGRIADAGFECFFSGNCEISAVEKMKKRAEKLNLEFEFLHAPFADINTMWIEGDGYKKIYGQMIEAIDSAAECGINEIVAHISSGWFPPEMCDLGLSRYDALVRYAEDKCVTVAFENLRKVGNVAYFADRYAKSSFVRFCYDCGHEHCYTETVCFPDIFRDRMVCTHIHDNLGRDRNNPFGDPDMHILPFDGNVDYVKMMRKLDEYDYRGSLMLEVFSGPYPDMKPDEFIADAYSRIKKISLL